MIAQCPGKSPFRLRGHFPSSGQMELVHPKSEIVLRPRFPVTPFLFLTPGQCCIHTGAVGSGFWLWHVLNTDLL